MNENEPPFGMPMKERTSMDTSAHPSYMSAVVSVPIVNGGLVALNGTNCGVAYGATLSYGSGVTMNGTNGELSVVVNGLTPGLPVTAKVVISYLADNAQLSAMDSAGTAMLASTAVTGNAEWTIVFTPVEGRAVLKVGLFPYLARPLKLLEVLRVSWEQQVGVDYRTQLVRVGTRTGERYEFGYNGKYKDNEVAGMGNSQDYGFRMYDPRLARFKSVDPLTRQYPYYTPYQFAGNTPLQAIDLDGLEPKEMIAEGKLTKPMIALLHYGLGYRESGMRNTMWKRSDNDNFEAQTIYKTIHYGSVGDLSTFNNDENMYFDFWARLSGHEHKHRDEYNSVTYPSWAAKYGKETLISSIADYLSGKADKYEFYSTNAPSEKRAYGKEREIIRMYNFRDGFAEKTLKSKFSDDRKVGLMKFLGKSFRLSEMEPGSKRYRRLSAEVDNLKAQYKTEIAELDSTPGREVDLVDDAPQRK